MVIEQFCILILVVVIQNCMWENWNELHTHMGAHVFYEILSSVNGTNTIFLALSLYYSYARWPIWVRWDKEYTGPPSIFICKISLQKDFSINT